MTRIKHFIVLFAMATLLPNLLLLCPIEAFEWHAAGQRPEVTRQSIAGLWKITPSLRPMKEFTVHPKKNEKQETEPELLLMLKEDGSFQEYASDESSALLDDDESVEDSWKRFKEKQKQEKRKAELAALAKGTWDYRDGKLILAADRPSTTSSSQSTQFAAGSKQSSSTKLPHQDTLLEGRVVATYETSLPDNPVLEKNADNSYNTTATASQQGQSTTSANNAKQTTTATRGTGKRWDAHLAVPKGSVKVGKFFYPKHHPSFFDQPIYNPAKRGAFQLRQILGSLNTNVPDEDKFVEKFQRADFYNKTFLLTSHPLAQRGPKGNVRWSNRQNKFIEEAPRSKQAAKYAEDVENNPVKIRVMQVRFFPNNTFATVWGTGDAILRGKFDVIGQDSDSLWMHISRFGFGRSVSGSVFSEGRMLSQDDAKSYWGTIKYEDTKGDESNDGVTKKDDQLDPAMSSSQEGETKKLEVRGSVLFGAGLEPTPVGRFIMRETDDDFVSLFDEEDEDEDDDDISAAQLSDISASLPDISDEDGVDFSSDDDAFQ